MGHSKKGQVDREAKSKGTGHRLPAREQQSQQLLKRKGWGDRLMVRHIIREQVAGGRVEESTVCGDDGTG
jgi:hypothetical protein